MFLRFPGTKATGRSSGLGEQSCKSWPARLWCLVLRMAQSGDDHHDFIVGVGPSQVLAMIFDNVPVAKESPDWVSSMFHSILIFSLWPPAASVPHIQSTASLATRSASCCWPVGSVVTADHVQVPAAQTGFEQAASMATTPRAASQLRPCGCAEGRGYRAGIPVRHSLWTQSRPRGFGCKSRRLATLAAMGTKTTTALRLILPPGRRRAVAAA